MLGKLGVPVGEAGEGLNQRFVVSEEFLISAGRSGHHSHQWPVARVEIVSGAGFRRNTATVLSPRSIQILRHSQLNVSGAT